MKRESFRFTAGEPAYFESSSVAKRGFCSKCGTPLTFSTASPHISFAIGTFEPTPLPPPRTPAASQVSWLHRRRSPQGHHPLPAPALPTEE
ncbi:MAG: GFA family protein [Polyangiaceae bacterium]